MIEKHLGLAIGKAILALPQTHHVHTNCPAYFGRTATDVGDRIGQPGSRHVELERVLFRRASQTFPISVACVR